LNKILEITLDIHEIRNIYNVSKIGFLIDSSLSSRHLNNADSIMGGELDNGTNIFALQLEIAKTIGIVNRGVVKPIVQFDENGAW
jgi:hypothetical protein